MTARLVRLQTAILIAFALLAFRLAHLQLLRGGHYRALAEHNRLRVVPEQAPRGLIVDRRGRVLASNQEILRVTVVPQEVQHLPTLLAHVAALTGQSAQQLERTYRRERSLPFVPALILASVPRSVALRLEEEQWRLPGLLVRTDVVRHYPMGSTAAHLLGYVSQPTAEELPALKPYGVQPKHLVGREGLERLLDATLRGTPGGLMVEVNNRGRQVRIVGQRQATTGGRVALTLDAQLQSLIELSFGAQPGAAVVLDAGTGAALALVSVPAFGPEAFALLDAKAITGYFNDPETPMMNRATSGTYQPGSIAKIVTAAAGLEERRIIPQSTIRCEGSLRIGDRTFHCWKRDGHGMLDLTGAISQSCNVYFMDVARWVGKDRLVAAMRDAGLAEKTGWLLAEQSGHLPQRRLTHGELGLLGIGQGEILLTVMQAAVVASAVANGGRLVEPWVVESGDTHLRRAVTRRRLGWSDRTLEAVRAGMRATVQSPLGTGHRAATPDITIAAKTGTAQTHVPGRTHGWFMGYCPVDHPRLGFAVMTEHGGAGGDLPAEIARSICEYVAVMDAPAG